MKFVAPEQAPEQAEIIRNTPFWPDVDLSEFRSVMRTDGTVTQPRLKQVALGGLMIGVLMLAINWYYKHKAYQLLRDGQISREDYESINR